MDEQEGNDLADQDEGPAKSGGYGPASVSIVTMPKPGTPE